MKDKKCYFEIFKLCPREKQEWKWKFYYKGQVIAQSGDTYLSTSVNSAVLRLQKNIQKYERLAFKEIGGGYGWKVFAKNGNILAASAFKCGNLANAVGFMTKFVDSVKKAPWLKKFDYTKGSKVKEIV